MCNCLSETKEMLLTSLQERAADNITISDVEYKNVGIMRKGSQLVMQPVLYADYKATRPKKDGVTTTTAKATATLTFTYCPFCGVKYDA